MCGIGIRGYRNRLNFQIGRNFRFDRFVMKDNASRPLLANESQRKERLSISFFVIPTGLKRP